MAPIRRYLRITKYSVLEVRIYLDNPALSHTWLLNPRDPVLPRVIQAVRPLVLPKLREENERSKSKNKKKKGVKDVVHEDDFEVSIFLTDISTNHSLLAKDKTFRSKKSRIRSNSGKLTSWLTGTVDEPVQVDEAEDKSPVVVREESDDEHGMRLEDYPEFTESSTRQKRALEEEGSDPHVVEDVSDDEGFQALHDDSTSLHDQQNDAATDDKKKLAMNTSYDGFSIYGKILCLIVKRKGNKSKDSGQHMLENWVATQAAQDQIVSGDGY